MYGWLFKKKSVTMHGNMNVKLTKWQLPVPRAVTLRYSAFGSHSMFMFFMSFGINTGYFVLNNTNRVFRIMDVGCVLCKVETPVLYKSYLSVSLSPPKPVWLASSIGSGFLRVFHSSPFNVIPVKLHIHVHLHNFNTPPM